MDVENLKSARKSTGMTQKDVSTALNISPNTYKNYEQGLREPNGDTIVALANLFHVTADYLLGRPDAKPPEEPLDEFARKEHLKSLEKVFMKKYLALTEEQRDKVLDFLRGVVAEETAAQASKLKMSHVYEAARSTDPNNAPRFAEYPESELEKLDSDPDTDFNL